MSARIHERGQNSAAARLRDQAIAATADVSRLTGIQRPNSRAIRQDFNGGRSDG